MPLRVKGTEAAISSLAATHRRMTEEATAAMLAGAKEIQALAREFAPVDEGDLEAAISIGDVEQGPSNSSITVFVADESPSGRAVDQYATRMHEGSYKLGPLSAEKQARTGKLVGPKFLARAAAQLFPSIKQRISAALRSLT